MPRVAVSQVAPIPMATPPADTSHAERCLAAVDLALIAAESGIIDVSVEAMRRATRKGPPVASVDLGGLLSTKQNTRTTTATGGANVAAESAQAKLAARLHRLHQVWRKQEVDPAQAYEAFKSLVAPDGRPSEMFAYSVAAGNPRAVSYSNVEFDVKEPKPIDSAAADLVEWAKLSGKEDELLQETTARERFPGAIGTALLIEALVAQDDSRPVAIATELCEKLVAQTRLLTNGPDAELLFGHVWKMLERVESNVPQRQKLIDAVVGVIERQQNWATNEWLVFLVAKELRDSIDEGDSQQFQRYAGVAMSRYNALRSNNASYVAARSGHVPTCGRAGVSCRAFKARRRLPPSAKPAAPQR